MPHTDDEQFCPLLGRQICRGYCYEINEVLEDNMDIEHIEDVFEIEKSIPICKKCGWGRTPII